jgi:hypothetical protein
MTPSRENKYGLLTLRKNSDRHIDVAVEHQLGWWAGMIAAHVQQLWLASRVAACHDNHFDSTTMRVHTAETLSGRLVLVRKSER